MLPTPSLQAVVFDLDGTLLNTEELYWDVVELILARRGRQVTRALLDEMMGRPSRVALQIMIDRHQLDATVPQLQAETTEIFQGLLDSRLALMPGAMELLNQLRAARLPTAIATSSSRRFLEDVLVRLQLADRFQTTLTADDVVEGKPHPEIFLKAAERLAVEPASMLVLEDSAHGVRAAVASGAFTVAVPGDHSRQHDFAGAAFVATGLLDPRIGAALGLDSSPT